MNWSLASALGLAVLIALAGCSDGSDPASENGQQAEVVHPGEQTYNRYCFSCHAAGIAGAPKTGVAEHWAPRIAQGMEVLLQHTREGIPPGMPPMGLCRDCSDEALRDAIDFMVSKSQ